MIRNVSIANRMKFNQMKMKMMRHRRERRRKVREHSLDEIPSPPEGFKLKLFEAGITSKRSQPKEQISDGKPTKLIERGSRLDGLLR